MRCRRSSARVVVALVLAACGCSGATVAAETLDTGAPATAADTSGYAMLLVLPTVNGVQRDVALLLRDRAGRYYADAETLELWRVAPPYPLPVVVDGRVFHALDGFSGLNATVVERGMTATIDVPPQLLTGTRRSLAERGAALPMDGAFGAYLDYDVAYTDDDVVRDRGLSSLLSPTLFTRHGNLSANVLYHGGAAAMASRDGWIRLDTAWSRDNPDAMRTLRFGDTITPYGSWARSVHIGGIQFGTNFATRPDQVTFPQPSITGTAAVPSALDIVVNGSLRSRTDVPSGAFRIDDVPVVTGAGQIQVVTRDLLGREQIVTQDFYVSERLLKSGLNEFSVSAGALREDFGLASNEYGEFLVSGVLRRGLSDLLTIEGRVEATAAAKSAGASITWAVGRYGVTSAALALSDAEESGALWQLGHEYQGRTYRAYMRVQGSYDFAQPGLHAFAPLPKLSVIASGGRNFGSKGSIGLSYIDERFAERADDRQLLTLSYSRSFSRSLLLATSVSHIDADDGGYAAAVTVSRVLGPRSSASTSLSARRHATTFRIDHRYELPVGEGFGYRTSLVSGDEDGGDAEVAVNTAHARYSAEVSQRESARGWRLQTRGSVAMLGGEVFAAREINDGFAVVDAGGFEGVRVYLENREIGKTNAHGRLLVPSLRPYEGNQLRIESEDLPLTARVDTPALRVAPYYRSGAIASFGIKASGSALLRAVTPGGVPLPEGARARVGDGAFRFPVGFDGRLYLQDLDRGARVEVAYGSERCTFALVALPAEDAVPDFGDVVCQPIGEPAAPVDDREQR